MEGPFASATEVAINGAQLACREQGAGEASCSFRSLVLIEPHEDNPAATNAAIRSFLEHAAEPAA